MDPASIKIILDTAGGLTVTGLLVLILVGGAKDKPWWVFGTTHRRVLRELEMWRALALKGANINESTIKRLGQALDIAESSKSEDG